MARPKRPSRRGRGEGSVYQKTRTWIDKSGKRHSRTVWVAKTSGKYRMEFTGTTADEARTKRDNHLIQKGKPVPRHARPKPVTVREFSETFLENRKTNKRPATHRDYANTMRHILEYIGDNQLAELSDEDVKTMYRLVEGKVSGSMHKRMHVTLRAMVNYAIECKVINVSPLATIRQDVPRYKPKAVRPLDESQIAKVLKAVKGKRLEALIVLALDSGARQGELFALEWDDMDLNKGTVYIQRAASENDGTVTVDVCKTDRSRRSIDICSDTVQALRQRRKLALKEGLGDCRLVFPSERGQVLRKSSFIRRTWIPIRKAAGIESRFHDLRHTCAVTLLKANIHPKVVQDRLGHASIVQTMDTYSAFVRPQAGAALAMGNVLHRLSRPGTLRVA